MWVYESVRFSNLFYVGDHITYRDSFVSSFLAHLMILQKSSL